MRPRAVRISVFAAAILSACLRRLPAAATRGRLVTLQKVLQIYRRDTPLPADIYRPQITVADPVTDCRFPDLEEFEPEERHVVVK